MTEDYKVCDNTFTGKILKVTVDVKEMDAGERAEGGRGHEGGLEVAPR